jgi:hypothetical protein
LLPWAFALGSFGPQSSHVAGITPYLTCLVFETMSHSISQAGFQLAILLLPLLLSDGHSTLCCTCFRLKVKYGFSGISRLDIQFDFMTRSAPLREWTRHKVWYGLLSTKKVMENKNY